MKKVNSFKEQIIAVFSYEHKNYVIFLINHKIYFGYKAGYGISTDLTEKESQMLEFVYHRITVNYKTSIDCGTFKIRNKWIRIFYDITTNLKFFFEQRANDLFIPAKEDLIWLNTYFNHQEGKVYKQLEEKKKNSIIKRFVKINGKMVTVFLASTIAFHMLPKQQEDYIKFSTQYYTDSFFSQDKEQKSKPIPLEEMVQAIEKNPNLTKEEKEFFLKFQEQWEENAEYIDFSKLIRNFEELKIQYHPYQDLDTGEIQEYDRYGDYTYLGSNRGMINLYGNANYPTVDFENCDQSTLYHEGEHASQNRPVWKTLSGKMGDIMISISTIGEDKDIFPEMVNELFSQEYFQEISNQKVTKGYQDAMPVMYALCEILDDTTLRKYQFNPNSYHVIIDNLLQIDDNMSKACELLTSINSIDLYKELIEEAEEELQPDIRKELEDNYRKIYRLIESYYEKKYQRPMEEDLVMLLYFHNTPYEREEMKRKIDGLWNYPNEMKVIPKGYVSKGYQKEHPLLQIQGIEKDGTPKIWTIQEETRYLEDKDLDREK